MAFPVASEERARSRLSLAALWRRAAAEIEAYPVERIGLAALAAGLVLRIATPFFMDFRSDGDTYTAMGHAWAMHHAFVMPYGDVSTWIPLPPGYSNHYPPAYPFYLGLVFSVFGFGLAQAKAAAVVMSLASLAAVYACTRDLYGRDRAALLAGLVALEPHFVWATGTGFSENMVLLFFTLTMWAIMRSLTDDRYILWAGLFAALAYLTRSSIGYFFVIAGVGGLLWRLAFRGWSVLTNRWYVGAIALFGGIAGTWALRNVWLFGYTPLAFGGSQIAARACVGLLALGVLLTLPFLVQKRFRTLPNLAPGILLAAAGLLLGAWLALDPKSGPLAAQWTLPVPNWETSSYVRYVQTYALTVDDAHDGPALWWAALRSKIPWFLLFLAWWVLPFLPESWRATKKVKEEPTSALWLAVFLVWITAWIISAMFTVYEKVDFISNNHRYVVIGLLPLGWLVLREARLERASTRVRVALLALSLFAATGAQFLDPVRYSDLRAAEHMDPYLRAGDQVGVDGSTIKYAFYPYLSHPERIVVYGCEQPPSSDSVKSGPCHGVPDGGGHQAAFIVSLRPYPTYAGYQLVGSFRQRFSDGGVMNTTLWSREDVVADRNIATGLVKDFD